MISAGNFSVLILSAMVIQDTTVGEDDTTKTNRSASTMWVIDTYESKAKIIHRD